MDTPGYFLSKRPIKSAIFFYFSPQNYKKGVLYAIFSILHIIELKTTKIVLLYSLTFKFYFVINSIIVENKTLQLNKKPKKKRAYKLS